jgi:hypothetical protein
MQGREVAAGVVNRLHDFVVSRSITCTKSVNVECR